MLEEERRVLEETVKVGAKRLARAEAMRAKREKQVKSKRQDAEEEAAQMEA